MDTQKRLKCKFCDWEIMLERVKELGDARGYRALKRHVERSHRIQFGRIVKRLALEMQEKILALQISREPFDLKRKYIEEVRRTAFIKR